MLQENTIINFASVSAAALLLPAVLFILRSRKYASGRKDSEQALRESKGEYLYLFESNPHAMWIYDLDSLVFLAVNDAAVQHYGYSRKEFLFMTLRDIRPPEEIPAMLETVARLRPGINLGGRWRHRKKDGTIIDVHVHSHSIIFGGRQARFVMVNDVTESKRATEALRRSEEKYRDLFENANDAIFIVDSELRYRDANKKAVELLGYSKEELLAKRIPDLIPPEQTPRSEAEFKKLQSKVVYDKFVGWVMTSDGRRLDVEVSSSAIVVDGKVVGSRDIMRDITDRKKLEEELLRTQKLESLGILAGGLAHDFNNLLTSVFGNISLAKLDARPGEAVHQRLDEAEKALFRAQDLTQQLLTFSRGGAPVKKIFSVKELVRGSASFSLRGSKARCVFSIPDELRPVEADEGQLSQVINNLVINADQAMPEGGTVTISCENITVEEGAALPLDPGKYLLLSVADQGIGIPQEHFEKIFDPYFTTKQKGSGLGLATSYSIIKRHGGHITVESEMGSGTTFRVYLPAVDTFLPRELTPMEQSVQGRGRILVMDDDEMIRDVAGRILGRLGYEVEYAADGAEALVAYGEARKKDRLFDVVIMDLTIPGGMGGKETIRKLRELDPKARAIVSSGYSNDPIMAEFREYGFSGVVAKPYSIRILGEAVKSVLSDANVGEEGR